jgi:hypothetical protein
MTYFLSPLGTNIIGAEGLTTVFGMGTGVALPLLSPGKEGLPSCALLPWAPQRDVDTLARNGLFQEAFGQSRRRGRTQATRPAMRRQRSRAECHNVCMVQKGQAETNRQDAAGPLAGATPDA